MANRALGLCAALTFALGVAPRAGAATDIPLTIAGNTATGHVDLPGGIAADLTITFDSASGLSATAIDASAGLVNPLDVGLLLRLPATGAAIPLEFPVLLRIEPSASSTLSFHGVMSVELHTPNLDLRADLPLALFSAPTGGTFSDVSASEAPGSYRVAGSKGTMSEYLIIVDTRPVDGVISGKFSALQSVLNANAGSMPPAVLAGLQARLTNARSLYQSGQTAAARDEVGRFDSDVRTQSGAAIPDLWRAHDTLVDVAGLLRSGAETLTFSLNRKLSGSP